MACGADNHDVVKYLLRRAYDGKFVFPLTNPVAKDNLPLACACSARQLQIAERLLERDLSGDYI